MKYLILVIQLKKTEYNTKVAEIENKLNNHNHDKYIDTTEFNKLAANVFNVRIAQANLVTKTDFDAKLLSLNRKITSNKTKHLLVENELNKLKTFDSSYFIGKSHFEEDGTHNYLVFQPIIKYFEINRLPMLLIRFYRGNLKDYLPKLLNHLLRLIIVLLQN